MEPELDPNTRHKHPAHMRCACCAPTLISPATLAAVEQERTTLAWFHFRQDDGIRLFRVFSKLRDSGPKTVLSFKAFAHYFHVDPTKVRRARLLLTRRPQRVRVLCTLPPYETAHARWPSQSAGTSQYTS